MKLMDLLEKTNDVVYVYETYYDRVLGVVDGKNGVSYPILKSNVESISLKNNVLIVETGFNIFDFLKKNKEKLQDKIVEDFLNFQEKYAETKLEIEYLFSMSGEVFYKVKNSLYNASQLYDNIIRFFNDDYIIHILNFWGQYEQYLDLYNAIEWGL